MISFPVLIYQINFLPRNNFTLTNSSSWNEGVNLQSSRQQISCSSQIPIFHDSSSPRLLLHDPLSLFLWLAKCDVGLLVQQTSLSYQRWLVDNGIINSQFLVLASRCLGCEVRFSLSLFPAPCCSISNSGKVVFVTSHFEVLKRTVLTSAN